MGYIHISELADIIGQNAACVLCQERGGTTVYIPRRHARGNLVGIIGEEALAKLVAYAGGCSITLPARGAGTKKARILALLAQGLSVGEIVAATGVSERYVRTLKPLAKLD